MPSVLRVLMVRGLCGGRVINATFDVAEEGYIDVERELAAMLARD